MDDFILGDRELDVMGVLWDLGSGTVAEVRDKLPADLAYTTVLTILRNLEAKEFVYHTAEGKAHRTSPPIARLFPAPLKPVQVMPFRIVVDIGSAPAAIDWSRMVDRGLIGLWVALSVFLALRILRGVAMIERSRGEWKRGRVNGVRVKLSD